MAAKRTSRTDTWISLLVFLGVLIVYIVTLCPSLYPGDALGAVTAATKTRFVRAVEYPVWRLVARLFSDIVCLFGAGKAWSLNLFSAVCGAASVGLLYRIFVRFSHTRTRDELVRFRGQPNLARFAALSAVLLLAFTQTFWRSSILAGTAALNVLLLVWATYLLLRYKATRRKRYFVMYAIVYAAGLANFPTMLLLFPIYLVLSILWCREAYTDLVTLVISVLAAAVVFGVAVFHGPATIAANPPAYFVIPLPVTTPLFQYVTWYWAQIRPVFPMGGLQGILVWLLWLVLPTLPPVLYLAFTNPTRRTEMGRGSAISDDIFRFLSLMYTLFGIMVLLDLVIGPYPWVHLTDFLVAYAVAAGWLCYMLGYWAIVFTGKKGGAGSGSLVLHARGGYAVLIVIFLLLPVVSVVKHLRYNHASLAGFTLLDDFAEDTIRSAASAARPSGQAAVTTERPVVLVIRDGWGDLLRYAKAYGRLGSDVEGVDITLVDLASAAGQHGRLVDKYAYLRQLLVGREVPPQRDPRLDPTLSDSEAVLGYIELGRQARPDMPAPRVVFTSDADRFFTENAALAAAYTFVPRGLVYLLDLRASSANVPADQVQAGHAVWDTLALRALEDHPPGAAADVVRAFTFRAAKLANDFGVYCHRYESQEAAVRFYKLALALNEESYSPLRNMQIAGESGQIDNFDTRLYDLNLMIDNRVDLDIRRRLGGGERAEETEAVRRYERALLIVYGYGLVRDPTLLSDLVGGAQDPRAMSYAFRYAIVCLRVMIDPDEAAALAERGVLYLSAVRQNEATRSIRQTVQALIDLQTALPHAETPADRAQALYWIGEANILLRDADAAKKAFSDAIDADPNLTMAYSRLAEIDMATGDRDAAVALVKRRAQERPPTTREEVFVYLRSMRNLYMAGEKPDPEGFLAEADVFKATYPDQALNTGLFLFDAAMADKDYERAKTLIDELGLKYSRPSAVRLREAQLANAEKRYEDVLAITLDEKDPLTDEENVNWLNVRGNALLRLWRPAEALEQFEAAYTAHEAAVNKAFADRAARLQTDQQRRENETARRNAIARVQLTHSLPLWYASIQAYLQHPDEALREKTLRYALMHYQLMTVSDQSEAQKLLAAGRYGWTQFKVLGETQAARAALETTALGLPQSGLAQLEYGALLIAQGDVEQGVTRLAMADARRDQLDNYEAALLDKLIEEHKELYDRVPKQPGSTAGQPELNLDSENGTSGENTNPDSELTNPVDPGGPAGDAGDSAGM